MKQETSVSVNRDSEPCYSSGNESKFFNYKTDYTIEVTSVWKIAFTVSCMIFLQGCLRSFIQSKVIETCGCAFYKYALPNGTVSYCGIEKSEHQAI